jgi:peptide/nickel transport system substrate-binding protein
MNIRQRGTALAAIGLLLLGSGCATHSGSTVAVSRLRIIDNINPTQLNPILEQNGSENFIDGLIFSELVTIDPQGHDVPDLAQVVPTRANGGISKNGLTITYHLRPNATWQDGAPVTSHDVKFTWEQIMNPANNVLSRDGYDDIASIDTPNAHTVVLHMKKLYPPAVDTIFGESDEPYRILPEHLLAAYHNLNEVPFNADPVGSGPYRFVRWERNDRIVLAANPTYYLGKPKIARLDIMIVTDANTAEALLRSHQADLGFEITGSFYHDVADDPHVVRQLVGAPAWAGILLNTRRAPLNDPVVRRALDLGINKTAILNDDTYGSAEPIAADQTRWSWADDRSLTPIPYDPKLAESLLSHDGWKRGPGGIRVKDGKRLSLQLAYGFGSSSVENMAAQMQQMLKGIGVALQLKGYQYQLLYASAEAGGILNGGRYDMAMELWTSGADPDDSAEWSCTMFPPVGVNVTHYCSPAMQAAQRLALSTFDRAQRKAAYATVQKLLLADVPTIFLYAQNMRYAHIPQLHHFDPNGISEGWNAYQWSISP